MRARVALRQVRSRLVAAWGMVGEGATWLAAAAITAAMRVLWVDPTLDNVKDGRYPPSSKGAAHHEVERSETDVDALLAYAQAVADETDDAVKAGRDKTRTLITLTGFFLTALAFIVRDGAPSVLWTSVAFAGVAVAALLLHRSLRVTWHNRLILNASDLNDKSAEDFKRSHAADLLYNARSNDGVVSFIVDIHRAAMRALLIALAATLLAALWPQEPASTEAVPPAPVQMEAPSAPIGDHSG